MPSLRRNLIYDVGAHVGEDTEFYLRKGFFVVAIEADPELVERLKTRFRANLEDGTLVLVQAAIAERAGMVEFHQNRSNSEWGTIRSSWAERNRRVGAPSTTILVPAITFEEVLHEHGVPYYLKVDIEGADLLCIEALSRFDIKPTFVSLETAETWQPLQQQFDALQRAGYNRFKIVDQAALGPYSSGPFGNDLTGGWLTADRALREYKKILAHYRRVDRFQRRPFLPLLRVLQGLPIVSPFFKENWHDVHAKTE